VRNKKITRGYRVKGLKEQQQSIVHSLLRSEKMGSLFVSLPRRGTEEAMTGKHKGQRVICIQESVLAGHELPVTTLSLTLEDQR
jgi:hypothetical protein